MDLLLEDVTLFVELVVVSNRNLLDLDAVLTRGLYQSLAEEANSGR